MARILHISVTAGSDPTGRLALQLACDSAQRGHHTHLAFGRGPGSDQIPSTRIASPVDLAIQGFATRLADRHAMVSSPSAVKLCRLIDSLRPDLIHLHNIHGYYLSLPELCRLIANRDIPAVMTLHDAWPLTGHCATPADCSKFTLGCTTPCPRCSHYPKALVSRSEQNLRDKAHSFSLIPRLHIVAPSQYMLDILAESHLARRPASLIRNGIDTRRFRPDETARSHIALAVSRHWSADKGIDDLLELRRHLPDNLRIVAVGQAPPGHRRHHGITYTGAMTSGQLIELYRRAAVLVNPSHGESFSLVKAEALACGTPVASYAGGAAGELLTPPYGISVPTGGTASLARAAVSLAIADTNPAELHDFAARHFNLDKMLQQYNDLYNQLLK